MNPFVHTLRAEITKTFTLRSIRVTIVAALVVPAALSLASGLASDTSRLAQFPVASHGFETAGFGQPFVILLAALIAGAEYLDGQLRSTLLATPRRGEVLAAKVLITGVLAASIGVVAIGVSVLVKHAALGAHGLLLGGFSPGMGWNLLGVALNYALIAVIATAITIVARTLIATLVVLVPLVLGITISLVGMIPALKFLPDLAGIQLLMPYPGVGLLGPLPGSAVMAGWAFIATCAAATLLRIRDVQS